MIKGRFKFKHPPPAVDAIPIGKGEGEFVPPAVPASVPAPEEPDAEG